MTAERRPAIAHPLGTLSAYTRGVAVITLCGLLGRTVRLGSVPLLWGDEAFTGVAVRQPLGHMLDVIRHDNHPPLAYLLGRAVAVFSTSPAALRLVSALAGTAAIPLAAALGRRVAGDRAGLLAAAAVAAYPQFLLASRDTRMYALATTMVLAAALALWRSAEDPNRGRLVVYGLCVCGAAYSHYFAALAMPIQLLVALACFRPPRRTAARLAVTCLAGCVTLVPWLIAALPQFQHVGAPFWIPRVTWTTILPDLPAILRQAPPQQVTAAAMWLGELLAVVMVIVLLQGLPRDRRPGALFLLGTALLPTLGLLAISVWKPLYDPRFAGIFWGSAVGLVGASLIVIRPPWLSMGLVAGLGVAAAVALVQVHNPDYNALLAPLSSRVGPRDIIALNGPTHYFSVAYAVGPETAGRIRVVADDVPWYFGVAAYPPGTIVPAVPDPSGHLYLVSDAGQTLPAMYPGVRRLDQACRDGVCVGTYRR